MAGIDFAAAEKFIRENHNGLTDEQNEHRFNGLIKRMMGKPPTDQEQDALDAAPIPDCA